MIFAILTNRPLLTQTNFNVEVHHNGERITAPRLIVWRIANAGVDPITPSDFETPLACRVDGAEIVSAEVSLTRPRELSPALTQLSDGRATLEKRLMNSFDMIEVQMLVDGEPTHLAVEGRVAGVRRIERGRVPLTSWGAPWRFSFYDKLMAWIAGIILAAIGVLLYVGGEKFGFRIVGIAILIFAVVINPWWVWRRNRNNRLLLGD